MRPHPDSQWPLHATAALLTAALLVLAAWLLARVPGYTPAPAAQERLQLRFVPRSRILPPPPAGRAPAAAPAVATASGDVPRTRPLPGPRAGAASAPAAAPLPGLYDGDGRVRLPEGTADAGAMPAPDPMRRASPVDYRETRFEGDWVSDGDLADVAGQAIARGQRKVAELLLGKDIQHAEARPPPDVRFNPGRHERPSDLGSEATGDAWRAAPISAEPAPGLDGRASRSIREQVAALEREHARCPRARMEQLMEPVRQALEQLQAVEHAMARGADPIRARHQLPNTANSAWDQARRGLWHARQQLAGCRG